MKKTILFFLVIMVVALAAGCAQHTVEIKEPLLDKKGNPVFGKDNKPLMVERKTTVGDQARAAQLALGHQIVAGVKSGEIPLGRTITPGRDANIGSRAGSDREKPPPEEAEPGATEPVDGEE